jgi:hypothetical protein
MVVAPALIVLALLMASDDRHSTPLFDKLQTGMTRKEVENVLGPPQPGMSFSADGKLVGVPWLSENQRATILFNREGTLVGIALKSPREPSFFDRLWGALGF